MHHSALTCSFLRSAEVLERRMYVNSFPSSPKIELTHCMASMTTLEASYLNSSTS
jgi:hypothetical protein